MKVSPEILHQIFYAEAQRFKAQMERIFNRYLRQKYPDIEVSAKVAVDVEPPPGYDPSIND